MLIFFLQLSIAFYNEVRFQNQGVLIATFLQNFQHFYGIQEVDINNVSQEVSA